MNANDPTSHLPGDSCPPAARAYSQQSDAAPSPTTAYTFPTPPDYADAAGSQGYPQHATAAAHHPPSRALRHSFDPGVDLIRYIGSAVVTAVTAALLGYLGVLLIDIATSRLVPATYWIDNDLPRPEPAAGTAAWLSAAAAIVAAGLMWLLLTITNRTSMFFTFLTALVAVLGFVLTYSAGPWQTTLGPALLIAVVIAVIGVITACYTRLSLTTPACY